MTAKIKLNAASGGGSVSIQAPSSSSNTRVFTLPDSADGNIVPSNYGNSFIAYLSADATIATSTTTSIVCNTEVFDIGAAYNTSNGRFTPNVAGIYWIKTCLIWATTSSSTNNAYYGLHVNKNGTRYFQDIIHITKQDWHSSECSGLIELNGSSDYVDLDVWHNRGGDEYIEGDNVNKTHFEAYWVRALP